MTEVWFRNPKLYVRELAEVGAGANRIAWDRGSCVKYRIDPHKFASLYFGQTDWRILMVGEQGTTEIDSEHNLDNPVAVYPTWAYGEDHFSLLEEMITNPIGQDMEACNADVNPDVRPVFGQPHRVVITHLPDGRTSAGKNFLRQVRELQEDYPKCIIHVHGLISWRLAFGMGFGAADIEPRTDAANKRIVLPTGKIIDYARAVGAMQWINILGMSVSDLRVPRNRCIYNIKSALWAGENFDKNIRFKTRGQVEVDPDAPDHEPAQTKHTYIPLSPVSVGDKEICDTCSLSNTCKYYREGAVCSLPGTENSQLARYFRTRDSGMILEGLGRVLEIQTQRAERGLDDEQEYGEMDPEVTKQLNSVFSNGVKLAKLVDPSLTKPGVQINVGQQGALASAQPAQLVAAAVSALEARGINRADITPRMLESVLAEMTAGPMKAIPMEVVSD